MVRHGTYKLKKPFDLDALPEVGAQSGKKSQKSTKTEQYVSEIIDEMNLKQLQEGADIQKKKIKDSQLQLQNANHKMRDLTINIRLKEQLIRDLVKSGREADLVNKRYAEKIKHLEKVSYIDIDIDSIFFGQKDIYKLF